MNNHRHKLIFILVFFAVLLRSAVRGEPVAEPAPLLPGPGPAIPDNLHDNSRIFHSPRLEYNEWLPVGRGDPLKNDPTYDYSPPVLDRVRYWSETPANKDKGNDILLLGVPSKKSSIKEWNNVVPVRRNYYSQPNNQLPTVLMPPPMNNLLGVAGHDTRSWPPAATHRQDNQHADGFKYRPHSAGAHYPVPKHPEGNGHQISANQHFQTTPFNKAPYTTTIRLTTPAGEGKRPLLQTILQNENSFPFTKTSMTNSLTEYTSNFYNAQNINAMAQTVYHPPQTTEYLAPEPLKAMPTLSTEIKAPFVTPAPFISTTLPPTTKRPPSMTTDSFFSHYKQPTTPVRGPLYLIIEGHSKVKTYGLNNNDTLMQLPRMVPVAGTENPVIRHVVNRDSEGEELTVPHITREPIYQPVTPKQEQTADDSPVNSLLNFLDTSFGGMLSDDDTKNTLDSAETEDGDGKSRRSVRSVPPGGIRVSSSFLVADTASRPAPYGGYRRGTVEDVALPYFMFRGRQR